MADNKEKKVKEVRKTNDSKKAKDAEKANVSKRVKDAEKANDVKKNDSVEVVFILDRSGSMSGLEADTIGGFNATLKKQKEEPGEVLWSTVLFDDRHEVIHDRVPISEIRELTEKEYYVRGCTALLDAIGRAIHHIGNVHKYAREEDVPGKTMFVITTDGMENASVEYTYDKIKRMIEKETGKYGWEFIFLGANMDAVSVAGRMGIRAERSATYINDEKGIAKNYGAVSAAMLSFRTSGAIDETVLNEVREDYRKRSKKVK